MPTFVPVQLFTSGDFSYLLSSIRFIILPPGSTGWSEILSERCGVTLKENKKYSGAFDECLGKLSSRGRHRIFHLAMPFGTLLVEGRFPSDAMEKLCLQYSGENRCAVVYLKGYDPAYCKYPEIMAWENGELIRQHAPGLKEKYTSYLEKQFIDDEMFKRIMDNNKTLGNPLPCEENPDTLQILAYYQWTVDMLMQSGWKMTTTDLD